MHPYAHLLVVATLTAPALGAQDGCVVCHGEAGQHLQMSVHAEAGVSCADCHGGATGDVDLEDPHSDDMRALSDPREALESCGGCHSDAERMRAYGQRTDQLTLYWTSAHGQRLAADEGAQVATCVSCHGAHAVFVAGDPRSPIHPHNQVESCGACHGDAEAMAAVGLTTHAVDDYKNSVHGRALIESGRSSSPACSSCHGSHGALPPRVETLGQVCGSCHGVVREHFEGGPHGDAARAGLMSECISCHGHHGVLGSTDELLSAGDEEGQCGTCHSGDADPALAVAQSLRSCLMDIDALIGDTERALAEAAGRGLFIDREQGYLAEARGLRVRAGALVHGLSPAQLAGLEDRVRGTIRQTEEGLAKQKRGLRDRRVFVVLFFLVVLLLGAVLMVFRRELAGGFDRRAAEDADGEGAGVDG